MAEIDIKEELRNSWTDFGDRIEDKANSNTAGNINAEKAGLLLKNDIDSLGAHFTKDGIKKDLKNIGADTVIDSATGAFVSITSILNPSQYENLGKDVLRSMTNVIQRYIDNVLSYILDTETVTIGSLMHDIAPYATAIIGDSSSFSENFSKNLSNLSKKFEKLNFSNWDDTLETLSYYGGKFVDDVMMDGDVQNSLQQLSIIQTYANTLNTISSSIEAVQKLINILSPIIPIVHATYQLSMIFWSKGASIAEWSQETATAAQKYAMQLAAISMYYIKKYVYSIEIDVPKIFVSDFNIFSVKNASRDFDLSTTAGGWLSMFFNNDFYDTAVADSEPWLNFLNDSVQIANKWTNDLANLNYGSDTSWWQKYGKNLTFRFMTTAVANARADAYNNTKGLFEFLKNDSEFNQDTPATDYLGYNMYEVNENGDLVPITVTNDNINKNFDWKERAYIKMNAEFMLSASKRACFGK